MTGQRMFVAVWPPPEVVATLSELARPADPDLRWTPPEQWHITLRFLGRVDDDEQARLTAAWEHIVLEPAHAVLGPATRRFGERILHVPVAGLERLADLVVASTAGIGEPPEPRAFSAHLTLARARRRTNVLRQLAPTLIEARWEVAEITLVVSHTRAAEASYETVARRPVPCHTART